MQQIKVPAPSFLNPGLVPEGVLEVSLPFQYTADEATPFQLAIKEEEEEEIAEVSDSEDYFEVFN